MTDFQLEKNSPGTAAVLWPLSYNNPGLCLSRGETLHLKQTLISTVLPRKSEVSVSSLHRWSEEAGQGMWFLGLYQEDETYSLGRSVAIAVPAESRSPRKSWAWLAIGGIGPVGFPGRISLLSLWPALTEKRRRQRLLLLVFLRRCLSSRGCISEWPLGLKRWRFTPCCWGCILWALALSRSENFEFPRSQALIYSALTLLSCWGCWDTAQKIFSVGYPKPHSCSLQEGLFSRNHLWFLFRLKRPQCYVTALGTVRACIAIHEVPRLSGAVWPGGALLTCLRLGHQWAVAMWPWLRAWLEHRQYQWAGHPWHVRLV